MNRFERKRQKDAVKFRLSKRTIDPGARAVARRGIVVKSPQVSRIHDAAREAWRRRGKP